MKKITNKVLKDSVQDFKNNIIRDRMGDLEEALIKDSIFDAVKLAYNDSKRTMRGIGEKSTEKQKAIDDIVNSLNHFFVEGPPENDKAFNEAHHQLCQKWCNQFKDSPLGTYGKAQKIVNMAFKYLYCCSDQKNYINYFKYCHMPLDSFTLEWIKRQKNLSSEKITAWSNLQYGSQNSQYFEDNGKEYYSYLFYYDQTQEIIKNTGNYSALELEFVIWPQIRLEIASEAFYFTLMEEMTNKDKKIFRAKDSKDKLDAIRDFLNASTIE